MNEKKKLKDILKGVEIALVDGPLDIEARGVVADSRLVKEGFVFVAAQGVNNDGHNFIKEAMQKGAGSIVAQRDFTGASGITKVIARDSKKAAAEIAHNFYGRPADKMKIIGITGTNGKTTVSYLVESVLKEAGFKTGVIGTISYRYGPRQIPATNTTPGPLQLAEIFHYMAVNGADYVSMEVSSHSLKQGRVQGIDFKTAVFTNITAEHMDYHKDMQEYRNAKAVLFEGLNPAATAALNIDDNFGSQLAGRTPAKVLTYSLSDVKASVRPADFSSSKDGIRLNVNTPSGKIKINSRLCGKFNMYNILAAVAAGAAENINPVNITAGIEAVKSVPGRLQEVSCGQPFKVFIDYAHTDDALKNVLTAIREFAPAKIITMFGCGGDRDIIKRPRMGRVASELSDYVVITTDNPRSERPESIAEQVIAGVEKPRHRYVTVVLDRQKAIKKAVEAAGADDVVLLAGKGHETYQIFKNMVQPFDDMNIAKKALGELGYSAVCSQ